MPRRGVDEQERNAALIMTYFHPFTLNPDLCSEHVPFLGNLCVAGKSWHDSLRHWFDGRLLCEETKRYVNNFLAVTRTRPEEEEDVRSEEQFSDDELVVGAALGQALDLHTRRQVQSRALEAVSQSGSTDCW